MLRSQQSVRILGPADLPDALEVLGRNPVTNVFAEYRARITQLDPRWMGGQMWGYVEDGRLQSLCHVGANLVPVEATPQACDAFIERALRTRRTVSTIVGERSSVDRLWAGVCSFWGPARDERWDQPHLALSRSPEVAPDPDVVRTPASQIAALYPACVAMYTEEVGVSPEVEGGRDLYRTRVSQLVHRGWSFSRIEHGRVIFKAEVACATSSACQIQGVYVDPEHRGRGIGTAGMAAVVRLCLRDVAPVVALYVNAHNRPARAAYERVGFVQTDTFSTVMF